MKLGILTLHSGANYGGTLQCVALYNILKEQGHDVEVINFVPHVSCSLFKRLLYRITSARSVCDLITSFKKPSSTRLLNKQLVKVFNDYREKELTFSESCDEYTIANVAQQYEAIIVGSDQVWSSTVRSHLTYMSDWTPAPSCKLYSYAACAISLRYPIVRKAKIKRLLSRFEAISVRDSKSQAFVEQFLPNRDVRIDLDPTLLYSFDKYLQVDTINVKEPYILVYVLGREITGGNSMAINRIKSIVGDLKVIALSVYDEDVAYADVTIKSANPTEWMQYIQNARFVFTDSFHGEVFSIKFNKDFYVYYVEENRASRIIALSEMFHAEDRMITKAYSIDGTSLAKISQPMAKKGEKRSYNYIKNIVQ